MVDARNIYRKVTRKIYDFSPEQLANITAIVWLYRGQSERFIALVQQHLARTLAEGAAIADKSAAFRQSYDALADATAPFLQSLPPSPSGRGVGGEGSPLRELVKERDDAAKSCFAALDKWTARIAKDWKKPSFPPLPQGEGRGEGERLPLLKKLLAELDDLSTACRDLVKDVDMVFKLASRLEDTLSLHPSPSGRGKEGEGCALNPREVRKLVRALDDARKDLVEQLKRTAYFERQAHWLLSRFPDAKLVAVPGLVKLVDRKEIEKADWSLTPGRYVGVAPAEVDEDFDFEQTLSDIHVELADLNQEAVALAKTIQENFDGLGI